MAINGLHHAAISTPNIERLMKWYSENFGFEDIAEVYGWTTNNDVVSNGDPEAIKGDTITINWADVFPPTFRGFGKESRDQLLAFLERSSYESLLIFNPETFRFEPELATHWKIGTDSIFLTPMMSKLIVFV